MYLLSLVITVQWVPIGYFDKCCYHDSPERDQMRVIDAIYGWVDNDEVDLIFNSDC
jgi:hypothetical protein